MGYSEADDPASHGDGHRLRAVARPQLLHHVLDVDLDRFLGDVEPLRDVLVAVTPATCWSTSTSRAVSASSLTCSAIWAAICGGMRFFPAWTWRIASTISAGGMLLGR